MGFKCCSSYTIPAYLWTILSSISAVLCSIGLYFSNWLERETPESTYNSVSSFRLCLNETKQLSTTCEAYFSFDEIYSPEWKAITLLMGVGSCSLIFAGAMSLFGLCIRKLYNRYVTVLVAAVQCLGVLLFFISIIVFPAGISADSVRHPELCGSSAGSYRLGLCSVGWAYILVMVGTGFGAVAAGLSWTPGRWRGEQKENNEYVV